MASILTWPRLLPAIESEAIHCALGQTPTRLTPPSSPHMVPIVWVPWEPLPVGVGVRRVGECHAAEMGTPGTLPRQRAERAGWFASTPVSRLLTMRPSPR